MIPFIPSVLSGILMTAVLLKIVTSVVPTLEIEDWAQTFIVAIVATVIGFGTGLLLPMLWAQGVTGWLQVAISFALSVAVLALAIAIVPGIRKAGAAGVLLAAFFVRALGSAIAFAYVQFMVLGAPK
jgi:hypothetical protein